MSRRQGRAAWNGGVVRRARDHWRARLPLPCAQCGKPVTADQPGGWVVEHVTPLALGGRATDLSNQWVSHRRCSDASGSAVRAARRRTLDDHDKGVRAWL